jgi:hypothetical protein
VLALVVVDGPRRAGDRHYQAGQRDWGPDTGPDGAGSGGRPGRPRPRRAGSGRGQERGSRLRNGPRLRRRRSLVASGSSAVVAGDVVAYGLRQGLAGDLALVGCQNCVMGP